MLSRFQTGIQALADLLISFVQVPPHGIKAARMGSLHLLQTHNHNLNGVQTVGEMLDRFSGLAP